MEEAEAWYDNRERIVERYPVLTTEDGIDEDFNIWFCQQDEAYAEDCPVDVMFAKWDSVCKGRGGSGYL